MRRTGWHEEEAQNETQGRRSALLGEREKGDFETTGCKVLLVDDEPAVLSVIEWALQDFGCTVVGALGGREALRELYKERFDLMITDLVMPNLDGFSLLRIAGELDPKMKLIVMTGSPELLLKNHTKANRLDAVMVKPFGLKRLKEAISRCIGTRIGDPPTPAILTVEHHRFSAEPIEGNNQ
ncbi:MAG: response regulator [Desulfatiglandales bacterium]